MFIFRGWAIPLTEDVHKYMQPTTVVAHAGLVLGRTLGPWRDLPQQRAHTARLEEETPTGALAAGYLRHLKSSLWPTSARRATECAGATDCPLDEGARSWVPLQHLWVLNALWSHRDPWKSFKFSLRQRLYWNKLSAGEFLCSDGWFGQIPHSSWCAFIPFSSVLLTDRGSIFGRWLTVSSRSVLVTHAKFEVERFHGDAGVASWFAPAREDAMYSNL